MPAFHNVGSVAIACGGTGGHLFPGLAVAANLRERGVPVLLFVSPKEVDREAVRAVRDMDVVPLEAVGWDAFRPWRFAWGLWRSWRSVRRAYARSCPGVVLGMGGFTSVAPLLEGRRRGARTFLHESNAIAGRANRWLAPFVDGAFVGFPGAGHRLRAGCVLPTGTPVRAAMAPRDAAACRASLRLDPLRPTLLVMGGSQGASPINELVVRALADLVREMPTLQFIHLTGPRDAESVRAAYARSGVRAVVEAFSSVMEEVLGAADLVISRAGASSLAEFAAVRLPAILVPFPAAADRHQHYNATHLAESGAAVLLEQRGLEPGALAGRVVALLRSPEQLTRMREALRGWHRPDAAVRIVDAMLSSVAGRPAMVAWSRRGGVGRMPDRGLGSSGVQRVWWAQGEGGGL